MTRFCKTAFIAVLGSLLASIASAQLAGSRAGTGQPSGILADMPLLDPETAESYIAIDGRAELRVPATAIRMVLAVTADGATASACSAAIEESIARLRQAWARIGIGDDDTVVDFIAILPRYEWQIAAQRGVEMGVEQLAGYRMQTNVHLSVADAAAAEEALAVAFAQNVTDIIGFDYWSSELDAVRNEARRQAVAAARSKADVLLGAVFDERPRVINVQEDTTVRYPESLYQSFTNAVTEAVTPPLRRDIPMIRASRPQNTYYRGSFNDADVQPRELPMRPEVSVISTVRIYYASAAARSAAPARDD